MELPTERAKEPVAAAAPVAAAPADIAPPAALAAAPPARDAADKPSAPTPWPTSWLATELAEKATTPAKTDVTTNAMMLASEITSPVPGTTSKPPIAAMNSAEISSSVMQRIVPETINVITPNASGRSGAKAKPGSRSGAASPPRMRLIGP